MVYPIHPYQLSLGRFVPGGDCVHLAAFPWASSQSLSTSPDIYQSTALYYSGRRGCFCACPFVFKVTQILMKGSQLIFGRAWSVK